MVHTVEAFSGFSVDSESAAKDFYTNTLGLELIDEQMGLRFKLPGGGSIFAYPKPNHQPASFTILNFVVDDIDDAVDELVAKGANFEHYEKHAGQTGRERHSAQRRPKYRPIHRLVQRSRRQHTVSNPADK